MLLMLLVLSSVSSLSFVGTKTLPTSAPRQGAAISNLCAKRKGKGPGRIPGTGPPQSVVQQQREYAEYMKMREGSSVPIFDLYVRGPNSPSWYPCGSLGGDDKSKQLVESWMGGLLSDMAKGAIDKGVASSIFQDKPGYVSKVVQQYPQLKKSKDKLRFGYKIFYSGLLEKRPQASKVTEVKEDMAKGPLDSIKDTFSGLLPKS
ncbi:hypothetical protein CTAYLR_005853 [Chrysophaeum taylorii]|uniref:Uncharacterized protein n=1 Tax=Chrysophaeum taylorii TaxID=2483200 RepID=A0AAD7UPH6_9STRA|nr:hypothetical protein CTAYLR_005853 [Chrysophaeum taylorii]